MIFGKPGLFVFRWCFSSSQPILKVPLHGANYEMEFSKDVSMKPPGDYHISLGAYFLKVPRLSTIKSYIIPSRMKGGKT